MKNKKQKAITEVNPNWVQFTLAVPFLIIGMVCIFALYVLWHKWGQTFEDFRKNLLL